MRCELCQFAEATCFVSERLPSGQVDRIGYCGTCYSAKYLKPHPPDPGMPRLRLKLAHVMLIVLVFAAANGLIAFAARFDNVALPPKQRWARAVDMFLFINLTLTLLTGFLIFITWTTHASWYRRTGGLVPRPRHEMFQSVQPNKRWLCWLAWSIGVVIVGGLLGLWVNVSKNIARSLTRLWFPIQDVNTWIHIAVMWGPVFLILLITSIGNRVGRARLFETVRAAWARLTPAERAAKLARGLAPLAILAFLASGAPRALFGNQPNAVSLTLIFLLLFGVTGALAVVEILATRRRS